MSRRIRPAQKTMTNLCLSRTILTPCLSSKRPVSSIQFLSTPNFFQGNQPRLPSIKKSRYQMSIKKNSMKKEWTSSDLHKKYSILRKKTKVHSSVGLLSEMSQRTWMVLWPQLMEFVTFSLPKRSSSLIHQSFNKNFHSVPIRNHLSFYYLR